MTEAIDIPPFPLLTWSDYAWMGEVRLRSWAGFQDRRGAYTSAGSARLSDGTIQFTVDANEKALPTPEQIAAFNHLIDNEAAVAAVVALALFDYYNANREMYLKDYDSDAPSEVPQITDIGDLRQFVGLGSVHVLSLARDGVACIGFEFGCVWDAEHGAGVMTHRGRVIATGQADCSFVKWMAQQGLDGE